MIRTLLESVNFKNIYINIQSALKISKWQKNYRLHEEWKSVFFSSLKHQPIVTEDYWFCNLNFVSLSFDTIDSVINTLYYFHWPGDFLVVKKTKRYNLTWLEILFRRWCFSFSRTQWFEILTFNDQWYSLLSFSLAALLFL